MKQMNALWLHLEGCLHTYPQDKLDWYACHPWMRYSLAVSAGLLALIIPRPTMIISLPLSLMTCITQCCKSGIHVERWIPSKEKAWSFQTQAKTIEIPSEVFPLKLTRAITRIENGTKDYMMQAPKKDHAHMRMGLMIHLCSAQLHHMARPKSLCRG